MSRLKQIADKLHFWKQLFKTVFKVMIFYEKYFICEAWCCLCILKKIYKNNNFDKLWKLTITK